MGVYSRRWVRPQGGAGVLAFLQPGHLMYSLPPLSATSQDLGACCRKHTSRPDFEEDQGGSRSGKRGRDILLSVTLKVTALSLSLNLLYFQITQGTHCTLVSSGGPDFGDFITWKHWSEHHNRKAGDNPHSYFVVSREGDGERSKIHTPAVNMRACQCTRYRVYRSY